MKALVSRHFQPGEGPTYRYLVGAFSVIVKPMEHYTALIVSDYNLVRAPSSCKWCRFIHFLMPAEPHDYGDLSTRRCAIFMNVLSCAEQLCTLLVFTFRMQEIFLCLSKVSIRVASWSAHHNRQFWFDPFLDTFRLSNTCLSLLSHIFLIIFVFFSANISAFELKGTERR